MGVEDKSRSGTSVEKGEFPAFSFESFTQGKYKKNSDKNEDVVFVDSNTIVVIDGATSKGKLNFGGKTGGQYAALAIADFLRTCGPDLNGAELVSQISQSFAAKIEEDGYQEEVENNPEARPTASLAVAHIIDDELVITQLGDVGFRINGGKYHSNSKLIDTVVAKERLKAIKKERDTNPDISHDELLLRGREAIIPLIEDQIINYQNNSTHEYGYGVIDGREVPLKYIIVSRFKLGDVETLEIASDGYFMPGKEPTIDSWEEAFQYVEKVDPDKIGQFPSTKGSTDASFTDDRAVVIAKFKQ